MPGRLGFPLSPIVLRLGVRAELVFVVAMVVMGWVAASAMVMRSGPRLRLRVPNRMLFWRLHRRLSCGGQGDLVHHEPSAVEACGCQEPLDILVCCRSSFALGAVYMAQASALHRKQLPHFCCASGWRCSCCGACVASHANRSARDAGAIASGRGVTAGRLSGC